MVPLTGEVLAHFYNARLPPKVFRPIFDRVLDTLTQRERKTVRDEWIRRAAALTPGREGREVHVLANELRARMVILAGAFPGHLDTGMPDDCLALALLVNGRRVPNEITIRRALQADRTPPVLSDADQRLDWGCDLRSPEPKPAT